MTFFSSRKRYSIGEVLKGIFFRNPGIAKVLAVERDVKLQDKSFAKVEATNREGAFIRINTVCVFCENDCIFSHVQNFSDTLATTWLTFGIPVEIAKLVRATFSLFSSWYNK